MRIGGLCVLGAGGAGAGDGAGGRRRKRSDEAPDRKLGMPGCDDTERMLCCCERRALVTITSSPQSAAGGFTFSVGCESFRGCPAMRDAAVEAAADGTGTGVGVYSVMLVLRVEFFWTKFVRKFRVACALVVCREKGISLTGCYPSRLLRIPFSMLDDN